MTEQPRQRDQRIVDATGRAKAYRPLPAEARAAALAAGLEAYDRGDYFEAHEVLEPAWMGASDPAERDLYQGLIKLAAGFVHAVRGNPRGLTTNLRGARERLARSDPAAARAGIDAAALVASIDAVLGSAAPAGPTVSPGSAWTPIAIPRR